MALAARTRSLLSPPMLVALLALLVALGGTSYAAAKLAKNSVGARELKANAVTAPDVKDGSLKKVDFAAGQLPAGPPGATGSAAGAVITGRVSISGFSQSVNLTGTNSGAFQEDVATLTPNTTTYLRDFSVVTSTPTSARNFLLLVNGVDTSLCLLETGELACTQTGVITIPPSSHVAMTFSTIGEATVAEWGMTLSSS